MALTANKGSQLQAKFGNIQAYLTGALETLSKPIYRGALVALKQTDGKLYPAEVDADDSEKYRIVGFAMEAASADASTVRVRQDGKLVCKVQGTALQSWIGKLAAVYDDETIQLASVGLIVVGRITELASASSVYVDLTDRPLRIAAGDND